MMIDDEELASALACLKEPKNRKQKISHLIRLLTELLDGEKMPESITLCLQALAQQSMMFWGSDESRGYLLELAKCIREAHGDKVALMLAQELGGIRGIRNSQEAERKHPVLAEEAYQGAIGNLVKAIQPHTEADPAAILVQLLVGFGTLVGRNAYRKAEATHHYGNEFAVIVALSARGRKGTSAGYAENALRRIDPDFVDKRKLSGLSSGEGLIHEVRDATSVEQTDKKTGETNTVITDAGINDKRLLVVEQEFSRPLSAMCRDGCTLSAVIREAWDSGSLNVMTKSPERATGAHVSIVGHITEAELKRYMVGSVEVLNGFANRFLWIYAQRQKPLPLGGNLPESQLSQYYACLKKAYENAKTVHQVGWSDAVKAMWVRVYEPLTQDRDGMVDALTTRAEAHLLRLMTIYALADGYDTVQPDHMEAALAVVEYSIASIVYLFDGVSGVTDADRILQLLRTSPNGADRTDMIKHFKNHITKERLQSALDTLEQNGRAIKEDETPSNGGHREVWRTTPSGLTNMNTVSLLSMAQEARRAYPTGVETEFEEI